MEVTLTAFLQPVRHSKGNPGFLEATYQNLAFTKEFNGFGLNLKVVGVTLAAFLLRVRHSKGNPALLKATCAKSMDFTMEFLGFDLNWKVVEVTLAAFL